MNVQHFIKAFNMEMSVLDAGHKTYKPKQNELSAWQQALKECLLQNGSEIPIFLVNSYNSNMERILSDTAIDEAHRMIISQWRDNDTSFTILYPLFPSLKELECFELAYLNARKHIK